MKWLKNMGFVLGVVAVSGLLIHGATAPQKKQNPAEIKKVVVHLPEKMDFANETVPLHIADVKERFDREMVINTNLHSNTTLVLKRANRVFPVIEPILKKHGVPDDFKYLAVIESGLVNVVSPAGARGVWQFMPKTASEYGMEVNAFVDERYDLVKSTEAACRYLKDAKKKFGSWTEAAAAYNAGMAGVNKQLENQLVDNYYDLLLNEETSRYVFRILALKAIMTNPVLYGFDLQPHQLYHPIETKTVEVDTPIDDLAVFAKEQGVNYKILKLHNPWLRDRKLENKSRKKYVIEIPVEGY